MYSFLEAGKNYLKCFLVSSMPGFARNWAYLKGDYIILVSQAMSGD